jgi:TPR repeat protein
MAVLAEAFSVIIKKDALKRNKRHYKQFNNNIADKQTVCEDGVIVRVGFMNYNDSVNYLNFLRNGLELISHTHDNKAGDFVLVDMLNGPLIECDWLEFLRDKLFIENTEFEKRNEDFSIVWYKDNYKGKKCSHTEGFSVDGICFPKDWTPDNAIYSEDKSDDINNPVVVKEEKVPRDKEYHHQRIEELFIEADKLYTLDRDIDKALIKYQEIIDYGIKNIDKYYIDTFTDEVYNRFDNGTDKYLDHERAYLLFELGAKNGSILSLYFLGSKNVYSEGNSSDLFIGLNIWKEVSNYGLHTASFVLAQFYSSDKGALFDIDKAVYYCEIAKNNNIEDAEELLIELQNNQKIHSKKYLLNKSIEDLINRNYEIDDFYKLGESYLYGIVNEIDFEKAKQCYSDILDFELKNEDKDIVLNRFYNYIDDKFFSNPRGKLDIDISDLLFDLNWNYGCVKSQISRSTIFFYGMGREKDIPLAISMLEECSDFGDEASSIQLIDFFKSNEYGLKHINKAINYCEKAISNGVLKAESLLLPLQMEKENSEFEDIIGLFENLKTNYQKFTSDFYKSLNEIISIADRDYFNPNFIDEFYKNVKNRIDYQLDKSKSEKYINFIKYFADRDSLTAKKDLAKILFFESKEKNRTEAIKIWEELASISNYEGITYLMKVLEDDTYGTKDREKYFKYKREYERKFVHNADHNNFQKKESRTSSIKEWFSEKGVFFLKAIIIMVILKLLLNLPTLLKNF